MTQLGKISVTLSDDPRYVAGQTYDIVLSTPNTPDPSTLVSGTVDEPDVKPDTAAEAVTG